jgi:membrane protein YqaA with SNARE-associated domain
MSDKGLKKAILIGAVLGAVVTLGIALSMDLFFSDAIQGTWRDAAAKDVTRMFGSACGQNVFAVYFVLTIVMGFLAGFGAMLGAAAGLIMNRFFKMVLKL